MLSFTRLYNQHRFGSTPSVLKKLEEVHARLVASIKDRLFLVEAKAKIERSSWNGLEKLEVLAELFECFGKELPQSEEYFSALLRETEEIRRKLKTLEDNTKSYDCKCSCSCHDVYIRNISVTYCKYK